ncbi:hypothetical protein SLS60_011578 [Paraconiothyrium brasiliense]|uniref:Heterokaryon incompatibility domain-containing protein n=1 Tax=Paraconiothyrium brasiliense TaxID=300254 RepID=A0ABR3QIJ6_9PLEO
MKEADSSMANDHHLPPLQSSTSIRLIELEPREFNSDIVMSIDTYNLQDDPQYFALSYTWGDPLVHPYTATKPSRTVWIDTKPFLITPNLHDALNQLRFSLVPQGNSKMLLWIDAICINQDDMSERSHQVGLMGQIYAAASLVVSWVGKAGDDTLIAIELILRLRPIVEIWLSEKFVSKYGYDSEELFERAGVSIVKPKEWKALCSFYERQYFSRAWIVQEIALSQRLMLLCGHYIVWWDDLAYLSEMMTSLNWIPNLVQFSNAAKVGTRRSNERVRRRRLTLGAPAVYMRIRKHWVEQGSSDPGQVKGALKDPDARALYHLLELLIYETRFFQATDHRDNIYAVLAIIKHISRATYAATGLLRPDYYLPIGQVFINVTREIATQTDSTSIFSLIDHDSKQTPDLPSWVPDYSVSGLQAIAYSCPLRPHRAFNLAPRSPEATIVDDKFFLNAMRWGAIADFAHLGRSFTFQGQLKLCLQLPKFLPNGQTRIEAFWRTQVADTDGDQSPASEAMGNSFRQHVLLTIATWMYEATIAREHMEILDIVMPDLVALIKFIKIHDECSGSWLPRIEEVKSLWDMVKETPRTTPKVERMFRELEQGAQLFEACNNSIGGGRMLFRTSGNLPGLAPASAKQNDTIWFFPSSRVPFVLRHCGGDQYKLIGEAYLHGYMHGEIGTFSGPLQRISLV